MVRRGVTMGKHPAYFIGLAVVWTLFFVLWHFLGLSWGLRT